MEALQFTPIVDLPLVACTVIGFLVNFSHWSRSAELDTVVNLPARLPRARLLVVVLFALLVFTCWQLNVAVWLIYALMSVLSMVMAGLAGSAPSPAIMLVFVAGLIREWCFGFPQLILRTESRSKRPREKEPEDPMMGLEGIAISPLIPMGIVEVGGLEVPAVSDVGTMIDSGSRIVVTGNRNGMLSVRAIES